MTGSMLWLKPHEQQEVVETLLNCNLVKHDPAGKLPLAAGGTTDIYISLRDARNKPAAISAVAHLYIPQLMRLGPDRFVEIPDSVSCLAGPIAMITGIPYATIRKQPKRDRVSDAKIIGKLVAGEKVVIIDDVITDGASKMLPYHILREAGITDITLLVLVDRQGGWQETFERKGIKIPVHACMTLNGMRGYLRSCGKLQD